MERLIVGPILINKLFSSRVFDFDYDGLTGLTKHYVQPFDDVVSLIGDSLSKFLALNIKKRLTKTCRTEWEKFTGGLKDVPTMEDLRAFIKTWKTSMTPVDFAQPSVPSSSLPPLPSTSPTAIPASLKPRFGTRPVPKKSSVSCIACGENHGLLRCSTFQSHDVDKRNKLVREKRLCLNCFSDQHGCRTCPSRFSCRSCGGRHHTLLHKQRESSSLPSTPASTASTVTDAVTLSSAQPSVHNARFLHTVTVSMENDGHLVKARALLDSGVAVSVITEKLATDLNLKRTLNPLPISGATGTTQCKFTVAAELLSHDKSYKSDPITFTVFPKLPFLQAPPNRSEILDTPVLRSYHLADPDLGGDIDLLLNIHDAHSVTTGQSFKIGDLLALPTQFGLCLSGPLLQSTLPLTLMTSVHPTDLQDDLSRLWVLDQVPDAPQHSPEDEQAIEDFKNSYRRINGRFSVSLPRVKDPPPLGDTRRQALCRLLANEKSLTAKDKFEAFSTVMKEYLNLGHAHIVTKSDLKCYPHCYLPVHGVFKDSSTTTKVRAVFDASTRSSNGTSLNDTLLSGPNLYPPLPNVLIRFR